MATPLEKPIHRVVEINGEEFIAYLEPSKEFTLRKKRHKAVARQSMAELVGAEVSAPPVSRAPAETKLEAGSSDGVGLLMLHRIKAVAAGSPMDLKVRIEVLKAIDHLIEQEEFLNPENWD